MEKSHWPHIPKFYLSLAKKKEKYLETLWEIEKTLVTTLFQLPPQCCVTYYRRILESHIICRVPKQILPCGAHSICRMYVDTIFGTSPNFLQPSQALTLSQTTNIKLFQPGKNYRQQFQIWCRWKCWKNLQEDRKHYGKFGSLRAISPFPTVLSKDFCCRYVKTRACLGKG